MKEEIYVIAYGEVQGVGFRATVKKRALQHHIHGYTRNLLDGTVEICAQGSKEDLQRFLQDLPKRERLETIWRSIGTPYPSFEIIR